MDSINRRQFVTGTAAAAVLMSSSSLQAATHDHSQMHGGHNQNNALIDDALACIKTGEICMAHCVSSLKSGETELAKCLETAQAAVQACQLLVSFAANNSSHLPALAKLCVDVCGDCAKECKKHAKKHKTCKDCFDACEACVESCKKVA